MYVLDEPSIGLHQRDNDRLLATLKRLRDLGNSVIVVEHDEDAIRAADYVVDMGPGAASTAARCWWPARRPKWLRMRTGHRRFCPAAGNLSPCRPAPRPADPARWLTRAARAATT